MSFKRSVYREPNGYKTSTRIDLYTYKIGVRTNYKTYRHLKIQFLEHLETYVEIEHYKSQRLLFRLQLD